MRKVIGSPLILSDGREIPLSRAISSGGFVFVSGQLGLDESGHVVPGGIVAQTQQAISNIQTILMQAELNLKDVVKVTGWLTKEDHFAEFNRAYAGYFANDPPARSMVLSRLLVPGAVVELEAIAAKS